MKRHSVVEKWSLVLGLAMVVGGLSLLIAPNEITLIHDNPAPHYDGHSEGYFEHVSKKKCRLYGALAVVLGVGLGAVAWYQPAKR
ncbi:MAG: hypothetical protein P4M10_08885 [Verrucomicrobiae bacterium]|jgi:hypothetical protein|nr:hypothetical protein [Verrucomicrobiae bacterium]